MMTKKHFEAIARTLREDVETYRANGDKHAERVASYVVGTLAYLFAEMNPRFNRSRFLTACGLESDQ